MKETDTDYNKHVLRMESRGYIRNQVCIDETNKGIVTLLGLTKGCIGPVIDIRCPCGWEISVYGIKQVPKGTDLRMAHSLRIMLLDNNDNEIDLSTQIDVTRERVSDMVMRLARMPYSDVNLKNPVGTEPEFKSDDKWYRLEQSFELKNEDHLIIYVKEPNVDIDASKIKFALDCDMWECP